MKPVPLKVGDKVRVCQLKGKLGPTLWEVIREADSNDIIFIREAGTNFVEQRYYAGLLRKVDE